jgi:hypothetical protein
LDFPTWKELYDSELQGLFALIAVPAIFLLYRQSRGRPLGGVLPAAARFVDAYAIVFAIETILDPLISGLLARTLNLSDGPGATILLVVFVLLGDFRVYLLVFALLAIARGAPWTAALVPAAAWSTLVPLVAFGANRALHAVAPGVGDGSIWLIYESLFTAVALLWRGPLLAARAPATHPGLHRYLRGVLLYVVVYYVCWLCADLLIQVGGSDVGWLLRVLPNQLYYAFWVPVVFFWFFAPRYQSTSTSTQASR